MDHLIEATCRFIEKWLKPDAAFFESELAQNLRECSDSERFEHRRNAIIRLKSDDRLIQFLAPDSAVIERISSPDELTGKDLPVEILAAGFLEKERRAKEKAAEPITEWAARALDRVQKRTEGKIPGMPLSKDDAFAYRRLIAKKVESVKSQD